MYLYNINKHGIMNITKLNINDNNTLSYHKNEHMSKLLTHKIYHKLHTHSLDDNLKKKYIQKYLNTKKKQFKIDYYSNKHNCQYE